MFEWFLDELYEVVHNRSYCMHVLLIEFFSGFRLVFVRLFG